ncbi:unnamed protein product [Porites evermanni]|uniref:ShKT domain-containing protein n=1 Tax=Porites evermanni TaxID=104178 RepID=A0ABN8N9B5_9CNID|nr:unnamed protein product [Porites evermanni]
MAAKAFLFLLIAVTVAILGNDAMYLKRTSYPKPLPGERLEQFMLRARESLPRLSHAEDEKRNNLRLPFENDKRSGGCVDQSGSSFCTMFVGDFDGWLTYCTDVYNTYVSHANFVEFTQFRCKATCGNC